MNVWLDLRVSAGLERAHFNPLVRAHQGEPCTGPGGTYSFVTDAAGGRSMGEKIDDAWSITKVKTKLSTEHVKSLVNVDVDMKDGAVHLQGTVPTMEDKTQAERLARDTDGIISVMNDLKVASSTDSSPAASPSTR